MKYLYLILLLVFTSSLSFAQDPYIYINFVDCSQAQYPLTNVRSIILKGGIFKLNLTNYTTDSWPLSSVDNYNFSGFNCYTSIGIEKESGSPTLTISPNPSNSGFNIVCIFDKAGKVNGTLYNSAGQLIRQIIASEYTPGTYSYRWDGNDENGIIVPEGVYFFSLKADTHNITSKILKTF